MKFIDANFVLRYLLGDPQAEKVRKVLESGEPLYMPEIVFAEVVWTLTSYYKWKKGIITDVLSKFLVLGNIKTDKKLLIQALEIYRSANIDYIDAFIAAFMFKKGNKEIYTFDKHFDKIKGIKRIEPR